MPVAPGRTIVRNFPASEGTKLLRELVAALDGVKQVSHLMGVDRTTIAHWTRHGLPDEYLAEVTRLRYLYSERPDGRAQRSDYRPEIPVRLAL